MSLTTTYPGVYVVEKSSGVHTITGVATSITAFVGFTARGAVNEPVHIFSLADYERAFGGVSVDSPLSHAVRHFYTNGGSEAYVVRVAHDAKAASVTLKDGAGGNAVLTLTASSAGTWGNNLRIDVDYATVNPASLFNVTVTELVDQNGQLVVGRTESFLNLSMDDQHPSYAVTVLTARSDLVDAERPTGLTFGAATSTSGVLTLPDVTAMPPGYRVAYTLNGQGPYEAIVVSPTAPANNTLAANLTAVAGDLQTAMSAASPPGVTVAVVGGNALQVTATVDATHVAEHASVHFVDASVNSVTARLKLGTRNGGTEVDGAASRRPAQTGELTAGGTSNAASGAVTVEVLKGTASVKAGISLPLWNPPAGLTGPTSLAELVALLDAAFAEAGRSEPLLRGTRAMLVGSTVRIVAPNAEPDTNLKFSGGVTNALKLDDATVTRNVAAYAPGRGTTVFAQVAGDQGNNGTPPTATELSGSATLKTGIFALENVDLFNLMVIPDATTGTGMPSVLTDAIAYCERRRAFVIIDVPEVQNTFAKAKAWTDTSSTPLRSRNSALFFPWLQMPNPLNPTVLGTYGAAGALAGMFARTDAERGVWKAPAGTSATIAGASGLVYKLTDAENGVLNPLGINSLRVFPVYGTVSWGSRTGRGADALADEYKYIPVRRLALFLEESLYRGTQWVVFEPNDEPLWAQIRLNLGAFMHELYALGAFKGKTSREAYFVKCDAETTTQNDIDLGRVNIVIGFAPLKPAEFVIITIQQIAGNIQT
jgi:uncharacterized protein